MIAAALADARAATLRLFDALQQVLPPSMEVRHAAEIDPPLWLFGHLAWREELWIARNPRRLEGPPGAARAASLLARADALYDPGRVSPTQRWSLDLPDPGRTRRYLAQVRERTERLLQDLPVARDVLAFEDGLHERLAHLAQWLSLPVSEALHPAAPAAVGDPGDGAIDRTPVTWARYLPFVEAGGYADDALWTDAGRAWRDRHGLQRPRHVVLEDGRWQRAAFGQWRTLVPDEPALHLSRHEAQAWCRWAGRQLPSAQAWHAAQAADPAFAWGQVWEWTADAGLVGASFATAPRLRQAPQAQHAAPERLDLFAGFRSCVA